MNRTIDLYWLGMQRGFLKLDFWYQCKIIYCCDFWLIFNVYMYMHIITLSYFMSTFFSCHIQFHLEIQYLVYIIFSRGMKDIVSFSVVTLHKYIYQCLYPLAIHGNKVKYNYMYRYISKLICKSEDDLWKCKWNFSL